MIEFDNLKRSYISAIQWGLTVRVGYNKSKQGNEVLHKFCENLIENSDYNDSNKMTMKHELKIIKEALSKEIESLYRK